MEEENKEPTLKKLIEDLNYLKNLNNDRFAILGIQLYAEHYVNEIVMEQIKEYAKEEVRIYLTFPQKLKILEKMKCINDDTKRILLKLNSIRDLLVHNLIISVEELTNDLKFSKLGFKYSWIAQDDEGKKEHTVDLDDEYKKKIPNKYNQLIVSSIIIIGFLYHHLNRIRGKQDHEFIDVVFQENEKGQWVANLIVYGSNNPHHSFDIKN